VGHDWGGFLTVRLASLRGDLLRSWASDGLNAFDERFEWHDFAKIWQTPGAGEAWVESQLATPAHERAALLEGFGVPRDLAPTVAGWFDRPMGESMLALYRSAADIGPSWSDGLERVDMPGLAMLATADPFRDHVLFRDAAAKAHAATAELKGLGHWWMLENPAMSARVLETFWASIE
jgi:pimeloyl-ACP methyl ester carboxylesterase